MKRIVASLGVAALAAASVQDSSAQGSGAKVWTASVALRGFYDDNVNTAQTGRIDTFGAEISPTLAFDLAMDQTSMGLAYTYDYKYYDKQPNPGQGHDDQTHTIAASLMHAFSERTTVALADSFVIGQEPDVLRTGNSFDTFQRISGQNIRNYGTITLNHQFSPKFGVEVGYANSLFDYEDNFLSPSAGHGMINGFGGTPFGVYPVGVNTSYSGLLDRMDNTVHLDARWTLQSSTIALVGYAFNLENYTAEEPIGIVNTVDPANIAYNQVVYSKVRDSRSHYAYVGAEHTFRPDLTGSLRVGARFTDYFNSMNGTEISPYVAASLRYAYGKESNFQIGVSHDLSASDTFSTQGSSITTGAESTTVYGSITHRIVPNLFGTLMGQFQDSSFNGGRFDGQSEQYYLVSASLEYRINPHLSTSVSYHYDRLESDLPFRTFDRNRIYLGVTLTY